MTPIETAALDTAVKTTQGFFGKILGPMADEFGQQFAENMRIRRLKNQLKNLDKVRTIVEKGGIKMKEINFKAMFPLLEGMALEEDESLQDMWANLFTNYIDSAKNLTTHVYPDILRQLSSEEVKILQRMQMQKGEIKIMRATEEFRHLSKGSVHVSEITNLERLGIVVGIPIFQNNSLPKFFDIAVVSQLGREDKLKQLDPDTYVITEFGKQFLKACSR